MALGPVGSPAMPQALMDKCYQAGAAPEALLGMNGDAVADMFQWQSVLVREGVLNPGLIKDRWSDQEVRQGFRSGELFLSEATQMEGFLIHGNGTPEMPGYLANPEDMGVALMAKGNSLLLDPRGMALREGRRSVGTRGYWWGVPREARNRDLSFKLARYLSNTQNQIVESSAFGMIPVRQDLLGELGLMSAEAGPRTCSRPPPSRWWKTASPSPPWWRSSPPWAATISTPTGKSACREPARKPASNTSAKPWRNASSRSRGRSGREVPGEKGFGQIDRAGGLRSPKKEHGDLKPWSSVREIPSGVQADTLPPRLRPSASGVGR